MPTESYGNFGLRLSLKAFPAVDFRTLWSSTVRRSNRCCKQPESAEERAMTESRES
jgi:hypothetical protein